VAQECAAADLDSQATHLVTQRKLLQCGLEAISAVAQDKHVLQAACALMAAVYQRMYVGAVLETFVAIWAVVCVPKVVAEAHQFAQQAHQHIAALHFAHLLQHDYQAITVLLYVILAQAAGLVAASAAISTAAAV
jgi:hypothetical protein